MIQILQSSAGLGGVTCDPRGIAGDELRRLMAAGLVSIEQPVSTAKGGRPTTGKLVRIAEQYNALNQPAKGLLEALAVRHCLNVDSLRNTCSRLRREKRLAK